METILYLAATEADGGLSKGALEGLQAAVDLRASLDGATLSIGLIGESVQIAADAVAGCGAAVFGAAGPEFAQPRCSSDSAALAALVGAAKATLVLAPDNSRMVRALPGVAQRAAGRIDTHVTSVKAAAATVTVQRWYYRQRMLATFSRAQRPWFLLVSGGGNAAWQGAAGKAAVTMVSVPLAPADCRTKVLRVESPSADAQTIRPEAPMLFVAGAGWTKKQADGQAHVKEAGQLILGFLDKAQASLGSSKSLVDQGAEGQEVLSFLSHLNQVGQTGSTPRHPKGLSTCCHGEEPHVVGWRFIGDRRAINLDANCGWARGKADVVYVADAFKVMARVNELLG